MIKKQHLLRYSIGIIFLLFGGLKFFPQLSPAESICAETVQQLTFYLLPQAFCVYCLALFEVAIGVLLLSNKLTKLTVILAITHLVFTFTPFLLSPTEVFDSSINSFTLLGQYIIKNIIVISALLMIYPNNNTNSSSIFSK